MLIDTLLGGAVALAVFAYLFYVLLKPQDF
jgi:K+-transporting ATPase KdpF subunit